MKVLKILLFILKILAIVFISLVVGVVIFLLIISPASTKPFKDERGRIIENSIAKMEYVKIGGVKQFVLLRGRDINNPVLLILHGGPGSPELPMYRKFNSDLENYYTVVYWDQRGAGRSVDKTIPSESFTLEQLVEDAHELTVYLKNTLSKKKIFLLGHSWGSLLGMKTVSKYPDDYYAYVGTGHIGNQPKSDSLSYIFALRGARESNDSVAVKDLLQIGSFNDDNLKRVGYMNWLFTQRVYVSTFGGSTYNPQAAADIFILPILNCREYSLRNKYNMIMSNTQSAFTNSPYCKMIPLVLRTDLTKEIKRVDIPIYVLQGINDNLTNYSVAKEFFDSIEAKKKEFIVFEKSAHFPPFEEPEKFNIIMIQQVLKECVE